MKLEIDLDELTAEERDSLDDFLSANSSLPAYFVQQPYDADNEGDDAPLGILKVDQKIQHLHNRAGTFWPRLERIIDQLKELGPHSLDGDNALANTRDWLNQLSKR